MRIPEPADRHPLDLWDSGELGGVIHDLEPLPGTGQLEDPRDTPATLHEHHPAAYALLTLVEAQQQAEPAGVEERDLPQIDHQERGASVQGAPQSPLQLVDRRKVDLARKSGIHPARVRL